MECLVAGNRILDAQRIVVITSIEEIIEFSIRAAVFKARTNVS